MKQRRVFLEIIKEALYELRVVRARTALALTGIVIGAAAVTAMLHVGHNARAAAMQQFTALGTDLAMIVPQQEGQQPAVIPIEAVRALAEKGIGVSQASAFIQTGGDINVSGRSVPVSVLSASEAIFSIGKTKLVAGRYTYDLDGSTPFAVLGTAVAKQLGQSQGRPVSIGDTFALGNEIFTVIGVLADTPISVILSIDFNQSVIVPFEAVRRVAPGAAINGIAARLSSGFDDEVAARNIKTYFDSTVRPGGVSVQTARQLIASMDEQMRIYGLLLFGIGAVSLLVGGVGIMNVMLMSVIERRHEIGLRQALGARRSHIRLLFVAEALSLSLAGSSIGIAVGYGAGWIFSYASGWSFEPAPLALPLGFSMALIVGLFFGLYPADRAARLDPVAALRSE